MCCKVGFLGLFVMKDHSTAKLSEEKKITEAWQQKSKELAF